MREVFFTARFKRDMKRFKNRARERAVILDVIALLQKCDPPLPSKLREHVLTGTFSGYLECHALPDLLLVYSRTPETLTLIAAGSHAELFG